MLDFSNLGILLNRAGNTFTKNTDVPKKELKKITSILNGEHKNILKEIKSHSPSEFDERTITFLIRQINGLKRRSTIPESVSQALVAIKTTLSELKKQQKLSSRLPVKIEGISQKGIEHLNKDLSRHLLSAEKGLAQMRQLAFVKGQIPASQLSEITIILKKAHMALAKGMALHKTLALQQITGIKRNIIEEILENIPHLHKLASMQVRIGSAKVQSSTFRSTLKEFKGLLLVLKKLKESRGGQAAAVEKDTQR